jgi:AraC-like DNA-binding protein
MHGSVYREFAPRPELSELVVCTWERTVRAADSGATSRVLPDGSVDLVWDAARGVRLAGPDTRPVVHPLSPGSLVVGLRLRPGVAGAALGLPASEVRDERVDLDDVWGRRGRELEARMAGDDDLRLKRRILEQAVAERLPDIAAPDPVVLEAVRSLGRPTSRVGTLSDDLYISQRQLLRRFHEAVGYGPKTLDRVLRFRRFLARAAAIVAQDEDLAGAAADLGYADQAHLTRECVRLSGLTPQRLIATWTAAA